MNKEDLIKFFLKKREDFPIFKNNPNLIYVDNAASSQKPQIVIDKISNFYENFYSNINRSANSLSLKATEMFEQSRKLVADFIGSNIDEIVFTNGATDSLNLIAFGLSDILNKGDEIVLLESEHHSNIVAWQEIARLKGSKIKYISLDEKFQIDLNDAKKKITNRTKIVSIAHISNVLGIINPILEIGKIAKSHQAIFIVDATASIAHLKINVKEIDCDFLFFSSHKMCGPSGVGILYGKSERLQQLKPFKYGGGMICEVFKESSTFIKPPYKFEAGTPNIEGVIGFGQAIEYLNSIGMKNIEEYEKILSEYFLEKIKKIEDIEIFGNLDLANRIGIFSFKFNNIHPHDISAILDLYNIATRSGHHCAMPLHDKYNFNSSCRISFYFYNTLSDTDKIIEVISDLKNRYEKGEHLY